MLSVGLAYITMLATTPSVFTTDETVFISTDLYRQGDTSEMYFL